MINLAACDKTLFGHGGDPAILPGGLPIPAPLARSMLNSLPDTAKTWVRRLYTRHDTGELVSMDARARTFTAGMRHMLIMRDQHCRTPYCDAPARHADHVTPFAAGGPTTTPTGHRRRSRPRDVLNRSPKQHRAGSVDIRHVGQSNLAFEWKRAG